MCFDGILGGKLRTDLKLEMGKLFSGVRQITGCAGTCIRRPKIIPEFIVGIDTEKLLGLSITGMNTRNNLMTVHLKTQTEAYKADRMHIIFLAEQIFEFGDIGSVVFD